MTTKAGFETYIMYLALQRHFSTSYDFHKYNGKVRGSPESFQKRNDCFSFEKLSRIVLPEERIDFFVAHFIDDPKCWIRSMSKQKYEQYKSKLKKFPLLFKDDLEYLSQHNPGELMAVSNDIPLIHKLCIDKKVNVETLIAMDKFFPFIDKHKEAVKVPFVFPDYIEMLVNYRPFLSEKIDDIYKDIMKNVLLDNK